MRTLALAFVFFGSALSVAACSADGRSDLDAVDAEDAHEAESALTTDQKNAVCNAITPGRPWTEQEARKLMTDVVRRFVEVKRDNDALIRERGVGSYAGARSGVMKAIGAGDKRAAADAIRPHLRRGQDADAIVSELKGTSCIGWVYKVLRDAYADLGRANEWAAVEKCGRAWDSDGLHVQQALIKSGWPSQTLPLVNDAETAPGNAQERATHKEFLRAVQRGTYYGTPVARDTMLANFLPSPGSRTTKDESLLLQIGRSNFLAVSTLRAAYHVPLIVPAIAVPEDLAPEGEGREEWLGARSRGEPFVLESHSLRQPWDPTNFEVRPLNDVIRETFSQSVVYSTGTLLFSPMSDSPLQE